MVLFDKGNQYRCSDRLVFCVSYFLHLWGKITDEVLVEEESALAHITRTLFLMLGQSQRPRRRQSITLQHSREAKNDGCWCSACSLFSSFQDLKGRERSCPYSVGISLPLPRKLLTDRPRRLPNLDGPFASKPRGVASPCKLP